VASPEPANLTESPILFRSAGAFVDFGSRTFPGGHQPRPGETCCSIEHVFFNPDKSIAVDPLRKCAEEEVRTSPLIQRAAEGDTNAARALHIGFWPFVREFELAIDRHRLPRAPLRRRYPERFDRVFTQMARAVREMKCEEGSHAAHWHDDAQQLGIERIGAPVSEAVQELIDSSYSQDLPHFFSVLAGTELIAEELSAFLIASPSFTALFQRRRWIWGEIHLLPHEGGPSHLEIDLDLSRAYSPNNDVSRIESTIADTIHLFGRAATEVDRDFAFAE
jgi:hypothetical protein